jgi:hypothetical protein
MNFNDKDKFIYKYLYTNNYNLNYTNVNYAICNVNSIYTLIIKNNNERIEIKTMKKIPIVIY